MKQKIKEDVCEEIGEMFWRIAHRPYGKAKLNIMDVTISKTASAIFEALEKREHNAETFRSAIKNERKKWVGEK